MKKVLKAIWDEFIYGGHLAAIGPVIISLIATKLLYLPYSLGLFITAYLITLIAYTFDRYLDLSQNPYDPRTDYLNKKKKFLPFLVLTYVLLATIISFRFGLFAFTFTLLLILIGFLYNLFFKKFTRKIIGFKSFFVSVSYASTIFLLIGFDHYKFSYSIFLLFTFFCLRVLSNTIFCDIKDKKIDSDAGLKTFAVVMSSRNLDRIIILINILSALPIIYGVLTDIIPNASVFLLLSILYAFYYFFLSKKKGADSFAFANMWADGELIIWLFIFLGGLLWI